MANPLSTTEAADALGVTRITIYRNCKAGRLKATRYSVRGTYQISPDDLREFAQKYNYPCNLPDDESTQSQ